jgi:hypothetical protein
VSSELAPAAWLGLALAPLQSGWGAQLSVAWIGVASEPLPKDHAVSWSRWPLLLGPYLRLARQAASFELEAGPALAWLRLEGRNFSPNLTQSGLNWGAYATLRFLPKAGAWHPFVMAAPVLWFGRATAFAANQDGTESQTPLPSLQLLFAAGLRFLP